MNTPNDEGSKTALNEEEHSNWRFYMLSAATLVFTIYLIVDQYMTNHH